jgi:hypothetical protein
MGKIRNDPPRETVRLLERLRAGDRRAVADLSGGTGIPSDMVELRMARLYGRIGYSDGRQAAFVDVAKPVERWQVRRADAAVVLGITEEVGAERYIRAFKEIKAILAAMRGGLQGP